MDSSACCEKQLLYSSNSSYLNSKRLIIKEIDKNSIISNEMKHPNKKLNKTNIFPYTIEHKCDKNNTINDSPIKEIKNIIKERQKYHKFRRENKVNIIKNRIALIKQEEMKVWKTINEMKKKALCLIQAKEIKENTKRNVNLKRVNSQSRL